MNKPAELGRAALGWLRRCAAVLAFVTLSGGLLWAGPPADDPDCAARLEAAVEAISTHPRVKDVPRDKLKATTEFAVGNMLFVLLHEAAHGLISDLGIPVLGREENAADAFATVTMLEMKTEFTHRTLVNSAKSWMINDARSRAKRETVIYYDAHGLDLQRAYNIICLMVGSDGEQFEDLANEVNLPDDRQETCVFDYSNAQWSWEQALKPHRRAPDQPRTTYQIVYGKAEGSFDLFEQVFRVTGLMERVADRLVDEYAWKKPFTIEAQTCGGSGAKWVGPEHKITLCYELAEEFVQLYKLHGEDPLATLSPPAGSRLGVPLGFR
ncbi:MAG: DUF4344 domain-containing metallopeptidase [Xanthobacteraceae bacterium]